jgi:hypothetical protein
VVSLKLSDFTMFEKAPYELPDPRAFTKLAMVGINEVEKTYGPVFTVQFIKHALSFIAQKTREKPPEDIKTLDQLAEYLISKSNKYPKPYCAVTYAQVKTENMLQGQTGAGTRVEVMSISRNVAEKQDSDGRDFDVKEALSKIHETGIVQKIFPPELGYKKNEDGSVYLIWPKCLFMDACKLAFEEDLLKRPDGRMRCTAGEGSCQYFKIFSGYEWDYDLLEFDKPHCIYRCYSL